MALITRFRFVVTPMSDDTTCLRIYQVHVVKVDGELHAVTGSDDGLWR